MKQRARVRAGLAATALGIALFSGGTGAWANPRPPLEGAPELDKTVSYDEAKIPLGELVKKVAADTGARLTVAPEVADEPVALAVKRIPARELLEQVADLLDYQWARQGKEGAWRYEIWQDIVSRRREEALREGKGADLRQRFWREVQLDMRLAAMSPEQEKAALAGMDDEEKRRRQFSLQSLAQPVQREMANLLARLSPEQWAGMVQHSQSVTFSTDPQPGELPLPPAVEGVFHSSRPSLFGTGQLPSTGDAATDEQMSQLQERMQQSWSQAAGYRVTIHVGAEPSQSNAGFFLFATAAPLSSSASAPQNSSATQGGPPNATMGPTLLLGVPAINPPQAAPDPKARARELEQDPVLSVSKPFEPQGKPRVNLFTVHPTPFWPLGELLPEVARVYGVNLIADAYWGERSLLPAEFATSEKTPLFVELDRIAGRTLTWDHHGTLIRFRSKTWYDDRPREIPLRLVRQWQEACSKHGALSLAQYLGLVSALTDAQLDTLDKLTVSGVLPVDFLRLTHYPGLRSLLRLCAGLTPSQRQVLSTGRVLLANDLTAPQCDLLRAAAQGSGPAPAAPPASAAPGESGLAVTAISIVRVIEQRDGVISFRDEPVKRDPVQIPPGLRELLIRLRNEGAITSDPLDRLPPAVGTEPDPPDVSDAPSKASPRAGDAATATVTRSPVTALTFEIDSGQGRHQTLRLTVAS